jgi:hypothetical protein
MDLYTSIISGYENSIFELLTFFWFKRIQNNSVVINIVNIDEAINWVKKITNKHFWVASN